jgi:hypothetical protein
MTPSNFWTPDVTERVRRLYIVEGYSARETAKALGTTRNAIIGKADREKWPDKRRWNT